SETGEDDASDPQGTQRSELQDETPFSSPTGESNTLVDTSMTTSAPGLSQVEERSSWSGSQQTVVEKETEPGLPVRGPYLRPGGWQPQGTPSSIPQGGYRRDDPSELSPKPGADPPRPPAQPLASKPPVLCLPSPRVGQCPAQPASRGPGVPSPTPLTPRKTALMPAEYQDTVPEEYEAKVRKPKSLGYSQASTLESRPQTPLSETSSRVSVLRPSPKLARSGSKIFEKLKYFEERRRSLEQSDSPLPVHAWLPLRKTRSFDQPDLGQRPLTPDGSREELRDGVRSEMGGPTCRRQAFRHKAASFDERGHFASRVGDIEHRFSEELSRIKKTVSKQQLMRSQELAKAPSPRDPSQLSAPRALEAQATPAPKDQGLKAPPPVENAHGTQQLALASVGLGGPGDGAERAATRKPLLRSCALTSQPREEARARRSGEPEGAEGKRKVEQCPLSQATPLGRGDLPEAGPPEGVACLDGGPTVGARASRDGRAPGAGSEALTTRPAGQHGPHRRRAAGQEVRFLPWAKPGPELGAGLEGARAGPRGTGRDAEQRQLKVTEKKEGARLAQEGRSIRSKGKGRRPRPTSPELESSDDSYVSAGEDPLEAPVFEIPIQDAVVTVGAEVLLKCIVTANPMPEERPTLPPSSEGSSGEGQTAALGGGSKLEKMPSIPEEPELPENEVERFTMPDFLHPLHDLDVVESKEAVLECQVAGLPYPTITWFHNGTKIRSSEDRKMTQYKDTHRLLFPAVSHAHAGVYKSVIANRVGKATCYAHLYVTDVVPTPPDGPPAVLAVTGRTVTLTWNKPKWLDSAIDPASVTYTIQQQVLGTSQWTIVATVLRDTRGTLHSLTKGPRYLFRVLTATPRSSSKPSPPSEPVQLLDRGPYLEEAPVILDKPDVVYAVEDQPASVTVTLNHVEATVTWKRCRGGLALEERAGACELSMADDDQHCLRLCQVHRGDAGELTCEVSNRHGADSCSISLQLAEAPRFESIMEDLEVGEGETPRFAVVVEGKPLPDIMWYKDEALLAESSRLTFVYDDSECSLVLLGATARDSGVYTCTARNLAGEVSCKAELLVRAAQPEAAAVVAEEGHAARRLTDDYEVHEEIGRGAFSYVRRVREKSSGLDYAAKFIPCRAKAKQSARRELQILSQLDHERLVYFHDSFEKKNAVIIVMELCTGEELLDRMARKPSVCEWETVQRPNAEQTLEHPWFKTLAKGKSISTDHLKLFICRRKWQRSQISYKGSLVPRAIPELLEDTSSHLSIALPRHLKDSPALSSSSDSEELDELPLLPMPHQVEFSGSRVSLNEIPTDDEALGQAEGALEEAAPMEWQAEVAGPGKRQKGAGPRKRPTVAEGPGSSDEDSAEAQPRPECPRKALKKGSSLESPEGGRPAGRRGELRRGSSADSALLLGLPAEAGAGEEPPKALKKAASMELPRRSPSPGGAPRRQAEEERTQRLELVRQRLLRDGPVEPRVSGLRGPLLETLEKKVRPPRPTKQPPPGARLVRAASSEAAPQHPPPEPRLLQKSSSFSQGDLEPVMVHRRSGAPLEIPVTHLEAQRLKESPSLSALTESRPQTPRESSSKPPGPELPEASPEQGPGPGDTARPRASLAAVGKKPPAERPQEKPLPRPAAARPTQVPLQAAPKPRAALPEPPALDSRAPKPSSYAQVIQSIQLPAAPGEPARAEPPAARPQPCPAPPPAHAAGGAKAEVPAEEAAPLRSSSALAIKDIDSEEVFEAKFKRGRESSLSRGLKLLTRPHSEDRHLASPLVREEGMYRPGPAGAPLELAKGPAQRAQSVQDLREPEEASFIRRMSQRLWRTPPMERKQPKEEESGREPPSRGRRLSWSLGLGSSKDKRDSASLKSEPGRSEGGSESPVVAMRRKISSTMERLSQRLRSPSDDRGEAEGPGKRSPLLALLRRSNSEGENLRKMGIPQNQLAAQSALAPSAESFQSESSTRSEAGARAPSEGQRRSRWDRWGLSRAKRDKVASQPNIPASLLQEDGTIVGRQYVRNASDFPPVFHIKLKDQVLLEGDPATLFCLPAASPSPKILWMKDKRSLVSDAAVNIVSCKDGRQLLSIPRTCKKDAGLYECTAANALGTATSSCTLAVARLPGKPGTPEIPQKYKNTVLVLWKPADSRAPCTYILECKMNGEREWKTISSDIADCYFNVTELPARSTARFRVACINKAGQGPYSNPSETVAIETDDPGAAHSAPAARKDVAAPETAASSRSTQTPPAQPAPQTAGAPPPTPPRKHKGVVHMPGRAPQAPVPGGASAAIQPPPRAQAEPAPKEQLCPPAAPPAIAGSGSPELVLTPSRAAPPRPPAAHTTSQAVQGSPAPPAQPPARLSPISPASATPVSPSPKAAPMYMVTSFVSMPAATPPTDAPSPLPKEVVPSATRFLGRSATPSRLSPTGPGAPEAKEGTALRQGVPQKPYTFLEEKARGRFGVLRECKENATGKHFMAKIIPYEAEKKQSVLQEYEILKGLHHERVMGLHEAYITPRYLVLIAEHCAGKEILYSLVDRFRYSEDEVAGYVLQLLQGLEYLHGRRIVHLDIKPDNVVVAHGNAVKIIDFGSAQTYNPLVLRRLGRRVGTLEYMSPEMVKGDPVGSAADIWGVGVLTYIMLSGRSPFFELDPIETENRILAGRFDAFKLYPNASQSAALFIRKLLCIYPWSRPTIKDCFANPWLQDAYLMKLRRQTLTFTTNRLKEFLVEHQRRRSEAVTKHKVLLRSYHGSGSQPPPAPVTQ
ncbi:striated muscle-specific serine/threonine-protein kinase-like, partial [Terrapene carolina triunguis]|uniref:striated muscle-specific serine/threonine-protein kinase-like n=1 Tax=Terrapene triunguis TaxID=2587831 RepID=UPI000E77D41F